MVPFYRCCPQCKLNNTEDRAFCVIDSRPTEKGIRRRRKCLSCGFRFTTYEQHADYIFGPSSLEKMERDLSLALERVKTLRKEEIGDGTTTDGSELAEHKA